MKTILLSIYHWLFLYTIKIYFIILFGLKFHVLCYHTAVAARGYSQNEQSLDSKKYSSSPVLVILSKGNI